MIWAAIRDCAADRTRLAPADAPGWDWSFAPVSVLCEIDLAQRRRRSGPVLLCPHIATRAGLPQSLALILLDGHRLHLSHRHGRDVLELSLALSEDELWGRLRISYVRLPNGRAILTAELPDLGRIRQREGLAAPPLDPALVRALVSGAGGTAVAPDWVAAGAGRYRLGLGAAVAAGTRIDTPDGPRPVETLRPGDRVVSHDGVPMALTGTARMDAPALGGFRPVRLSAPFLGLTRDIAVHPNARILLTGTDVEYLTGDTAILIEARHLAHGRAAAQAEDPPVVTWFGLVLPQGGTVAAHGRAIAAQPADSIARLGRIAATSALAPFLVPPGAPAVAARRRPMVPRLLLGAEAQAVVLALDRRHAPFAA